MDRNCSRHMTRDDFLFSSITKINGGKIIFRDNSKEKISIVCNIGVKSSPSIKKGFSCQ